MSYKDHSRAGCVYCFMVPSVVSSPAFEIKLILLPSDDSLTHRRSLIEDGQKVLELAAFVLIVAEKQLTSSVYGSLNLLALYLCREIQ